MRDNGHSPDEARPLQKSTCRRPTPRQVVFHLSIYSVFIPTTLPFDLFFPSPYTSCLLIIHLISINRHTLRPQKAALSAEQQWPLRKPTTGRPHEGHSEVKKSSDYRLDLLKFGFAACDYSKEKTNCDQKIMKTFSFFICEKLSPPPSSQEVPYPR